MWSLTDPEARRGKHGQYYDGYQLDISMDADSEIIAAIEVLPANGDEAADAETLLRAEEAAHRNKVGAVSMDGAGFRGAVLRRLNDPAGLGVAVYVPVPEPSSAGPGYYLPEDFVLNEAGDVLTCPAGEQTRTRYRNRHDSGWRFCFQRSRCAACPLLGQCLERLPKQFGRSVIKNDHEAEYAAAREQAQTARHAEVRAEHPKVERKLAEVVRYHGGRRARYRGRWRVKVQYLLTAMVVNIKRMVRLLGEWWDRPSLVIPAACEVTLVSG